MSHDDEARAPGDEGRERAGSGVDEVAALVRLMGRPRASAPDAVRARVRSKVEAEWTAAVRRRRRRTASAWLAAAAFLLAAVTWMAATWMEGGPFSGRSMEDTGVWTVDLGVGTGARLVGSNAPLARGRSMRPGSTLATGVDGQVALRGADGTSLRLAPASRLRLLESNRLDLLAGVIYVDSPPDAGPLEVRTPFGTARDIGTQFEVGLVRQGLRLRVREGRVELHPTSADGLVTAGRPEAGSPAVEERLHQDPRPILLQAGEELSLAAGQVEKRSLRAHGETWRPWLATAPPFRLEGATVIEFLGWLAREQGWTVHWADPGLALEAATIRLHGGEVRLGPGHAPELVLETSGMASRLDDGVLHVFRRRAGS